MRAAPAVSRKTLLDVDEVSTIIRFLLHRTLKNSEIRHATRSLESLLTNEKKKARVQWALLYIDASTKTFEGMYEVVLVHEKWFFISQSTVTYYLTNSEEVRLSGTRSKRYNLKTNFLCAVARPRYEANRNCTFD